MSERQYHECQQCEHIHLANNYCGHLETETVRVGVGRLDFGRGVPYREIVTGTCRCDLRQGETEPFDPRYKMTVGTWEIPDVR